MLRKTIKVSKGLSVGPQPSEKMLEDLAEKGFKTIVNLSKKGELGQHLKPEEEEAKVSALGMAYFHFPVSLSNIKEKQIEEFCEELETLPLPVYVHCRIGQRSGPFTMIFHALKRKLSAQQALQKAEKLGMDWRAPMISRLVTSYLEKKEKLAAQAS